MSGSTKQSTRIYYGQLSILSPILVHLYHIRHPFESPTHSRRAQLRSQCNFTQEFLTCETVHSRPYHIIFFTPSTAAGGFKKMISSSVHARQPSRHPWTCERLVRERAIALGQAIDSSTWKNYGSALNSYLNFIKLHDFPLEPTHDTLSLFTVYMSHHIKLSSVGTYLSGICQQLEPYFPNVCSACNSALVHCTLQGCKHVRAIPTSCKHALTLSNLETIVIALEQSNDYDNWLFLAQLLTGFFVLFHLGEMTYPDDPKLRDPQKLSKCNSV